MGRSPEFPGRNGRKQSKNTMEKKKSGSAGKIAPIRHNTRQKRHAGEVFLKTHAVGAESPAKSPKRKGVKMRDRNATIEMASGEAERGRVAAQREISFQKSIICDADELQVA